MKRALVDTNIILDLLAKREPFHTESAQIFSLADTGEVELIVSALSLLNTHYVLESTLKRKKAKSLIGKFKVLVTVHELNDKIIELALNDDEFSDFEECVHNYTAIESQSEAIITRNIKDYKKSTLTILSPKEFISQRIAKR